MNIIKRTKNDNYSVLCNVALRDKRLSLQAKGLFAYIMSLPDDWTIYRTEIEKHSTNGKDSHRAAFNELISFGYIQHKRIRNTEGHFTQTKYTIIEVPTKQEENSGLPYVGKPNVGSANVGSANVGKAATTKDLHIINTDNNKKKTKTKVKTTPLPPEGDFSFSETTSTSKPDTTSSETFLSLNSNDTSVDFKSANMDNISDALKAVVDFKNIKFETLSPSVQRFVFEVVVFLNNKLNTKYKHTGKKLLTDIIKRAKEGYTISDFKKVIKNQFTVWNDDDKMRQYLRPSTLFGNKFENYLNTKIKKEDTSSSDFQVPADILKARRDAMFHKINRNENISVQEHNARQRKIINDKIKEMKEKEKNKSIIMSEEIPKRKTKEEEDAIYTEEYE